MCLPDFVEFRDIKEEDAIIGYRNWRASIKNSTVLISENQDYAWPIGVGLHPVKEENSGIYAYNNYYNYSYYNNNNHYSYYNNNNHYNNYNNNNNYYNYYNYYKYSYNYNYNYYMVGIIKQFGRVAIHKIGQRSERAKIDTLFNIRESDAKGLEEFLKWIKKFNFMIDNLAKIYNVPNVVSWQDFKDSYDKGHQ